MKYLRTLGFRARFGTDGGASAGDNRATSGRVRYPLLAAVACAAVLALGAAPASALLTHPFLSSFNVSSNINRIAIDQSTGDVYVLNEANGSLDKFDASGTPQDFSALGAASLNPTDQCTGYNFGGDPDVAVDNSAQGSQGNIYILGENFGVCAYDSAGNFLWHIGGGGDDVCGVATDSAGHVWVGDYSGPSHAIEYDNNGSAGNPPAQIGTVADTTGQVCHLGFDSAGNLFMNQWNSQVDKYVGGTFDSTVDPNGSTAVSVDPSDNHLFVVHASSISEYDATSAPAGQFGSAVLSSAVGVAVNGSSGNVYVSQSSGEVDIFGPQVVVPDVTTGSASNVHPTSATLAGTVNPDSIQLTDCHFEYGTTTSYGQTVPCVPNAASIPADSSDHAVTADISGLQSSTTYHFRLVAANANGPNQGLDQTFTTSGPPTVENESAADVTRTTATLQASVTPHAFDTTYHFEYGTTKNYGTNVPVPDGDIGSGTTAVPVSADISGLQQGATYHFRVVAVNSHGSVAGPDTTFTTVPALTIDSESVSDVSDTGATLHAQINPLGADTTYHFQYGTTTSYGTNVPVPDADIGAGNSDVEVSQDLTGLQTGATYHFRVVATNTFGTVMGPDRTFTTSGAVVPTGLLDNRGYEMVTPVNKDSGEVYERGGSVLAEQAATDGNRMAYFSFNAFPGSQFDGSYYLATRGTSSWASENVIPPHGTQAGLLCPALISQMVGYSDDLTKGVLLDGGKPLGQTGCSPHDFGLGEPKGVQNLFLSTAGGYQLVSLNPATDGGSGSPADATYDAVSADGSHVVFSESAQLTSNAQAGNNLYDWSGGTVHLVTILPDRTAAVGSLANGSAGSTTHAVSTDGSRIFFTVNGNLYVRENDSTTTQVDAGVGGGGDFMTASADGSRVFFTAGSPASLYMYDLSTTPGTLTNLTPGGTAGVQGVSGASSDGSYVYFVALDDLGFGGATAGQPNLFVWHNGTPKFIATLSSSDGSDWSSSSATARVSSNGTFIAFNSVSALTTYGSNGRNEIFLYDAGSDKLTCASCDPSGAAPGSPTSIQGPLPSSALGSGGGQFHLQRYVSDNGRVFFDTQEALVPTDTNGKRDVYEYENGEVRLISTGTSDDDAFFFDASPSGNDVFFTTAQQLVPQDTDGATDLYDARVGGGFPVSAPAPVCEGEGCKPPATTTPALPTAASITFTGPGNTSSPSTAKIRVLKRTVKGTTIKLRVNVPAAGRIVIAGTGLNRLTRIVDHAGAYTCKVHLTTGAKKRLKQKHKLKLTIMARYQPASGPASTVTVKLTVKA